MPWLCCIPVKSEMLHNGYVGVRHLQGASKVGLDPKGGDPPLLVVWLYTADVWLASCACATACTRLHSYLGRLYFGRIDPVAEDAVTTIHKIQNDISDMFDQVVGACIVSTRSRLSRARFEQI